MLLDPRPVAGMTYLFLPGGLNDGSGRSQSDMIKSAQSQLNKNEFLWTYLAFISLAIGADASLETRVKSAQQEIASLIEAISKATENLWTVGGRCSLPMAQAIANLDSQPDSMRTAKVLKLRTTSKKVPAKTITKKRKEI